MELNLLAMLVLGLGGGLLGLLGVLRAAWIKHPCFQLAPIVVGLIAAALAAFGTEPWQVLLPLGLIAFWALVRYSEPLFAFVNGLAALLRQPRVASGSLLVASPILAVVWSYLAVTEPNYWDPPAVSEVASIKRNEVLNLHIRTDAGRYLPVSAPERSATAEEVDYLKHHSHSNNVICTDAPGSDYNCHGWVFTGGKYWVSGIQVNEILNDNGYRPVTDPRPGDIIVYLVDGEVVHTGIVRLATTTGVFVESKWGMKGRFLHVAENQEYSQVFNYYRSDRSGHMLQGLAAVSHTELNAN